jgi:hypothetical protein
VTTEPILILGLLWNWSNLVVMNWSLFWFEQPQKAVNSIDKRHMNTIGREFLLLPSVVLSEFKALLFILILLLLDAAFYCTDIIRFTKVSPAHKEKIL